MTLSTLASGHYNLSGLLPQHWLDWDDYQQRLGRYEVLQGYYNNLAYHTITSWSQQLKFQERLYKHVRGVYNPASRAVEIYVSKVYGGILDTQEAKTGAIPIVTDNEQLRTSIAALWKASRWGQKKSLYVRNGANYGDSYLNIVDDIGKGNTYIEPVDPRKVQDIEVDSMGRITRIVYEYYIRTDNNEQKLLKQVIDEDSYTVTLDGAPYAMHENARGQMVSEWANDYGFVPAVHVPHRDVGMKYGGNAWYTVMHKINELNDLASIQNDGARRQVNMPLFGFGIGNGNLDYGTDRSNQVYNRKDDPQKDSLKIANYNKDGRLEAIAPTLDLSSSLLLIQEILNEIERDLPELSLHRLRDSGNATAPGVRAAYDDAIARIQEARGNYDAGLVEAQKMAIAIGGMRGYQGYEGFGLMSLERGDLEHYIQTRPVINDTLSISEQINLTLQAMSSNAPATVYSRMGWGESDVDDILEAQESNTSAFMSNFDAPQDELAPESPEQSVANEAIANVNESDLEAVDQQLAEVA